MSYRRRFNMPLQRHGTGIGGHRLACVCLVASLALFTLVVIGAL